MIVPHPSSDRSRFIGTDLEGFNGRIFGGQIMAQGLMAASRSETLGREAHSVHAFFLRPGDIRRAVEYRVTELLDGRSFANRMVVALQDDKAILSLMASFHRPEPGVRHEAVRRTVISAPQAVDQFQAWRQKMNDERKLLAAARFDERPIEIVPTDPDAVFGDGSHAPSSAVWMRLRYPVANDRALHSAILTYASDIMLLRAAMLPHGVRPFTPGVVSASLDHSLWIHEAPDMNQWLLFETESPWAAHARGLSRGHFFDEAGHMVGTVAQESLMRVSASA